MATRVTASNSALANGSMRAPIRSNERASPNTTMAAAMGVAISTSKAQVAAVDLRTALGSWMAGSRRFTRPDTFRSSA